MISAIRQDRKGRTTRRHPSRRGLLMVRMLAVAAAGATVAAMAGPASAAGVPPGTVSRPWPSNPDWQQYVLGPSSPTVAPVRVVSATGDVANPQALTHPDSGQVTTITRKIIGLQDHGPDSWPVGTNATASSYHASNSGGTYAPSNALDGNTATYWNNANVGSTHSWLEMSTPSPVTLPGLTFVSNAHGVPVDFQIQTLDAATGAWVNQVSVTGNKSVTVAEKFPAPVTTQHVRIFITLDQPSGYYGQYSRIAEVYPYYSPPAVLLVDYGKDVGGLPYFDIASESGSPVLHVSYSEAYQYANQPNGDTNPTTFFPRPGEDPHRYDNYTLSGPGMIRATLVQGAERYERITLNTPGTVQLSAVGVKFEAYDATPASYQGWFASSSTLLNKIWYSGAYTTQLDMVPANIPDGGPQPVIFDGAKRDRLIWIGDMAQDIPTVQDSLGTNGTNYLKQSLAIFGATQAADGAVGGFATPTGSSYFYSTSYSMYYVADVAAYYTYTGDLAFVRQEWPAIQRELAWNASNTDPSTGLLLTNSSNGRDWDFYDGSKTGAVTEFNALYYHDLVVASQMAAALGQTAQATAYAKQAAKLRTAINANLFDTSTGVYDISNVKRGPIAEDANVAAVLYGVAPKAKVAGILQKLKQLWIPNGSEPFSASAGYSNMISPYVGGFDVQARFAAGDTSDAYTLMRNEWGPMVRHGPQYTGAFWENVDPNGLVSSGSTSLAHGWSSGPTSALSEYVMGAAPAAAGYTSWLIEPHPGSLAWTEGQVPTPHGPITVRWGHEQPQGRFVLQASVPGRTTGSVGVPTFGREAVIHINGQLVWNNGHFHPAPGITGARLQGHDIVFTVNPAALSGTGVTHSGHPATFLVVSKATGT